MANKKWTTDQANAINAKNKSLLVSAAAGSGKTAVLVQRVINKITDKEDPTDINKMLIVTYTNAAANEMKVRITEALEEALTENPNDKNLQRQLRLMSRAKISTIHSFCSGLIKENFQQSGLSPSFKIANTSELKLLKKEAMDTLLTEEYQKGDKDFSALSELFSRDRDDKNLETVIDDLYEKLRPYPFKEKWLADKKALYNITEDVSNSAFGRTIINYARCAVEFCIKICDYNLELCKTNEEFENTLYPIITDDKTVLLSLKDTINNSSWDDISVSVDSFKSKLSRFTTPRKYKEDPIKLAIQANRDNMKAYISKLSDMFICNESEFIQDMQNSYSLVSKLFELELRFGELLENLKIEKNLIDFSDLEHFALNLLLDKNADGTFRASSIAQEAQEAFEEIMIDEYQDINEVQETIFEAISRDKKNIFMVGDVKQSIYRFRNAMPQLFLNKKERFNPYDKSTVDTCEKIILKKNFRSKDSILNGVNFIFNLIMSEEVGDINYNEEEFLYHGREEITEDINNESLDIHIIDFEGCEDLDKDTTEAEYIGTLIKDMVSKGHTVNKNGKLVPVQYGDFCILLRSAKSQFEIFENAFQELNIPIFTKKEGNFFDATEVSGIISFLEVIDNPLQDIPLLATLYGYIYFFSTDEVAKLRSADRKQQLYYSILQYSENDDLLAEKCRKLIYDLFFYKQLSVTMSTSDLIYTIYERTDYRCIISSMPNGELRLKNLRLLIEYAKDCEKYGIHSLSGFIGYMRNARESENNFKSATSKPSITNAVNVMSMHSSKGLEFPVCIIANTTRKYNTLPDSNVNINSNLGIGFKLRDETFLHKYNTAMNKAVKLQNDLESLSEEIRVLYVAMTRAREKLIIIGHTEKGFEKSVQKLQPSLAGDKIDPFFVSKCNNSFSLILSCLLRHRVSRSFMQDCTCFDLNEASNFDLKVIKANTIHTDTEVIPEPLVDTTVNKEILDTITKRFDFRYKFEDLCKTPTKVSVSALVFKTSDIDYSLEKRPSFTEIDGMTTAEKGSAVHKFLLLADFDKASTDLVGHINELLDKGLLSPREANAIDCEKIQRFFNGNLFHRLQKSKEIYREYSFTVRINSSELMYDTDYTEDIILQGEADCLFMENGEIVLVDYKTGNYFIEKKLNLYKKQMSYYAFAIEKCFGKKVKECIIYSLKDSKEIILQPERPYYPNSKE